MVLGTDPDTALAGDTPLYTQAEVDLLIANIENRIDNAGIPMLVTDKEGNHYEYLTFGDQAWTVENAEVERYNDGTIIPEVTSFSQWKDLTTGAWCYFDDNDQKGKLYNWYAVMGIHDDNDETPNKEFAPEGWHVPTHAEWTELENYLILAGYNYDDTTTLNKIAQAMASTTGWNTSTTDGAPGYDQNSNNSSGFNALPLGYLHKDVNWMGYGSTAMFWAIDYSDDSNSDQKSRHLAKNASDLQSDVRKKFEGCSVRFVKDLD